MDFEEDIGDDYLDWSDDENIVCNSRYVISSSSDEDADKFLAKLKPRRLVKKVPKQDGRDDFEREMDSELSATLNQLRASFTKKPDPDISTAPTASGSIPKAPGTENDADESKEFYDEIYFDSDDSGNEDLTHKPSGSGGRKKNRRILSNDELFYDPNMDDRDQAWMDKMRRSYQVKNKKRPPGSPKQRADQLPLPESDAVLNCPACLTMLCMDSQRHEIYHTQFRAMFVFNCNINWEEVLKFPKKIQKKKDYFKNKKLKKSQKQNEASPKDKTEEKVKSDIRKEDGIEGGASSNKKKEQDGKSNEKMDDDTGKSKEKMDDTGKSKEKMDDDAEKSKEKMDDDTGKNNQSEDNLMPVDTTCKIQISGLELETMARKDNAAGSSSNAGSLVNGSDELFHPVSCGICNTKVAVYDKDEVYHFFNIVTSH